MTRQQAIKIYLSKYRFSDVIIDRIMNWNPQQSIRENSDRMKLNHNVADALRKRFRLKYKYVGKGNNYKGRINATTIKR